MAGTSYSFKSRDNLSIMMSCQRISTPSSMNETIMPISYVRQNTIPLPLPAYTSSITFNDEL